jgi:hypothetical protein
MEDGSILPYRFNCFDIYWGAVMDGEQSVTFLSKQQVGDLVAIAERARRGLSRFSGQEIAFGPRLVQLLDEWIEDYLEVAPNPSTSIRLQWTSLLGEMFRRRHRGWWLLRDGKLVIVCPTDREGWHLVPVREQVDRRIECGMSESLTYFYNAKRIELRLE